jgi:hypothetical protein
VAKRWPDGAEHKSLGRAALGHRSYASEVSRVAPAFFKGILLGSVVAVIVSAATSAVAGAGVGAVFNLGRKNSVNATSRLSGSASGAMLKVANSGSGPALRLDVGKGRPPLTVNSAVKVANLNAGLLGGLGPSGYVQGGG